MKSHLCQMASLLAIGAVSVIVPAAHAAQPTATKSYKISVFAKSVPGAYTQPDSIEVVDGHVWIGFGDGVAKDGTDGKSSSIVEYDEEGVPLHVYSVPGHNDGLKLDPKTKLLWALQNEDGNPNLVILDPKTGNEKHYTFAAPPAQGGGYDDIAFLNGKVYFSASNPASDPNTSQAIVEVTLVGSQVKVVPILNGNAAAEDVPDDSTVTLNLIDPDSLTTRLGRLVMTNQDGAQLIVVERPGKTNQEVLVFPLKHAGSPVKVDDTVFVPGVHGRILVSDTSTDTIYAIDRSAFVPGTAYSAASTAGFVGTVNFDNGVITPIVNGLVGPHGMAFLAATKNDEDHDRDQPASAACETEVTP